MRTNPHSPFDEVIERAISPSNKSDHLDLSRRWKSLANRNSETQTEDTREDVSHSSNEGGRERREELSSALVEDEMNNLREENTSKKMSDYTPTRKGQIEAADSGPRTRESKNISAE
eukprot:scaffold1150_cov41-Attheya_sp.AAC.1